MLGRGISAIFYRRKSGYVCVVVYLLCFFYLSCLYQLKLQHLTAATTKMISSRSRNMSSTKTISFRNRSRPTTKKAIFRNRSMPTTKVTCLRKESRTKLVSEHFHIW